MKKLLRALILSLLAVSCWGSSIFNGDFETLGNRPGLFHSINLNSLNPPEWEVYARIPGWRTVSGTGIEVQSDTIVTAHSGNNYIELDSDITCLGNQTNSGMAQTVLLATGDYALNFYYRPRTGQENDNGILAEVAGLSILADGTSSTMPDWTLFTLPFTVERPGAYRVSFQAVGAQNKLGGFLDDVSISAVANPEPATLLLIGAGLLSLAALGRRYRH